jgi:hypothetical protein
VRAKAQWRGDTAAARNFEIKNLSKSVYKRWLVVLGSHASSSSLLAAAQMQQRAPRQQLGDMRSAPRQQLSSSAACTSAALQRHATCAFRQYFSDMRHALSGNTSATCDMRFPAALHSHATCAFPLHNDRAFSSAAVSS